MKRLPLLLAFLSWHIGVPQLIAGGNEVVVIYNSAQPDSKAVADSYARKRNVPLDQIFGFALPDSETMTRSDFDNRLQQPLAKKLEDLGLWQLGAGQLPGPDGKPIDAQRKVVASKIRYAVLCYGVPLKIRPDASLKEAAEKKIRPELRRNEAAVDSELACLPLLANGYTLAAFHYNPLYGATNAARLNPTNGILLVTRLDGPTPSMARALVDKAIEAEANGLWGRAYFDLRNTADPAYKLGDDWIRNAATVAGQLGFDTMVDTNADTFPASFPMSNIAIYMGWYREHVSGPFTLPQVEFMPGAFAYHLHSFSANSVRSGSNHWVGPLLAKGATCTMGSVFEPYLGGTPEVGTFASRWMQLGFTFGEAAYAAQPMLSWQTTVVGDPLYQPFKTSLQEHHFTFMEETNHLAEWSLERVVNLSRNRGVPLNELAIALEETPLTKESAVLSEKLADIYNDQGKPASAIAMYERALTLNPSPQQRVQLRLTLGEKLVATHRLDSARTNYERLLEENPKYHDKVRIEQKIGMMGPKPE